MAVTGMYVAPERVERDGVLVCFAGEAMTMAEAVKRGLVDDKPKAKPARRGRKPKAAAEAKN